jgi:hypothetical protein
MSDIPTEKTIEPGELRLTLSGVTSDVARDQAGELRDYIQGAGPGLVVRLGRRDPSAQDFGAVVIIVGAGLAAQAVAEGVRKWKAAHKDAGVRLEGPGGELESNAGEPIDDAAVEAVARGGAGA